MADADAGYPPVRCMLYTGATAASRLAALDQMISMALNNNPAIRVEKLLEGSWLANLPQPQPVANAAPTQIRTTLIAPGCPCCTGNLVFRLTLNKIIKNKPDLIGISLATLPEHMPALETLLQGPVYRELLATNIVSL